MTISLPHNPLLRMENVIATPHAAYFSSPAVAQVPRRCGEEAARVVTGQRPLNVVNPEVYAPGAVARRLFDGRIAPAKPALERRLVLHAQRGDDIMATPRPAPGSRPPGWQQAHARRYIETGGQDGHIWEGVTTLLLTTKGRRSGESRTTPLIYGRAGDRYLVVASRGGAPKHPDWYENLVAQPEVQVQVMADRFKARARPATAAEKPALWKTMTSIWPPYEEYQGRTTREIPVVVIERV